MSCHPLPGGKVENNNKKKKLQRNNEYYVTVNGRTPGFHVSKHSYYCYYLVYIYIVITGLRNEDDDDDDDGDGHFPVVFIKNYIDMFSNSVE